MVVYVLLAQGLGGCGVAADGAGHEQAALARLTVDEVEGRLGSAGFYVYDANPRDVFDEGHVPGAKWVGHEEITAEMMPADKSAALVFYCANEH